MRSLSGRLIWGANTDANSNANAPGPLRRLSQRFIQNFNPNPNHHGNPNSNYNPNPNYNNHNHDLHVGPAVNTNTNAAGWGGVVERVSGRMRQFSKQMSDGWE